MRIACYDATLASQHASVEKRSLKESLHAWTGPRRPDFEGAGTDATRPSADVVTLSDQAKAAQEAETIAQSEDVATHDPRLQVLISLVESLTGKKINIVSMDDLMKHDDSVEEIKDLNQDNDRGTPTAGFGVEYERHETHYEAEQTNFSAQGFVRTMDGKEIAFNLELTMSREYFAQSDLSLRLGDAARERKDPLVINFGGNAAQLTATKFTFDLEADGTKEEISYLAPGSGFLALDKNQDGKIKDGSELFGPASGNGYAELAAYDLDRNRWIDESDPIFAKLKIWSKDAQGNDQLQSLQDKGVGALYLGNVTTDFALKNASNQLDGQVRASSIYLTENGGVGTTQQIDLAV